jgi:ribosomal protein L7/L12
MNTTIQPIELWIIDKIIDSIEEWLNTHPNNKISVKSGKINGWELYSTITQRVTNIQWYCDLPDTRIYTMLVFRINPRYNNNIVDNEVSIEYDLLNSKPLIVYGILESFCLSGQKITIKNNQSETKIFLKDYTKYKNNILCKIQAYTELSEITIKAFQSMGLKLKEAKEAFEKTLESFKDEVPNTPQDIIKRYYKLKGVKNE